MSLGRLPHLSLPALLIAATVASAQPPAPIGAGEGMTLDQYLDHQTSRIMTADKDGDGRISRAEMEAMGAKAGHHAEQRFDAMDTNHDGYVDKAEIRAALTQRFQRMDSNGDGIVTPDEQAAARHHGHGEPAGAATQ